MRIRRLTLPLVVLPLAAATLLTGCSGDSAAEPTPSAQAEDTPTKAEPQDGADDGDADRAAGDLAECIIGDWAGDLDDVIAQSDAMMAATGFDATTTAHGEAVTTFAPGTVTTTYSDYVVEITMNVEGQEVTSITRMNGAMTQAYTLDGDVLTSVAAEDLSGIQIESTVLINGQELPGYSESFQDGMDDASSAGQSARQRVTCAGDTMTTETLGLEALGLGDFTATLTRR